METIFESNTLFQVAEIQLSYRAGATLSDAPVVSQSSDAFRILSACWDPDTIGLFEEFKVLLLNRANKVLGVINLSSGGMTGTVVDIKLVFGAALKGAATALILSHNHPSGNLRPSEADLTLTRQLVEVGKLLELPVLDHIILTPEGIYKSFADEGLM